MIKEIGDDLYEVRGNVFAQDGSSASFVVKIKVNRDHINYELLR
ncbi:hypothetical protein EV207_14043 [Scopulibacillus darangshiensis]|uniref:Uncharacterized protein n=1 Tax=Scopulibacillus darangshiensis TaxID=442528 RepID=A0A4R2NKM3_9BACL|nr:hypothetical protein [Scopulibacillus darangshiensis]TCP21734.1 hypothetical protein EV207_14043 [Scopulibacillus darangshiensis]